MSETIEDVVIARRGLARNILRQIQEFEHRFNIQVKDVSLNHSQYIGSDISRTEAVTIRLEF
jgi:hypothetical protein